MQVAAHQHPFSTQKFSMVQIFPARPLEEILHVSTDGLVDRQPLVSTLCRLTVLPVEYDSEYYSYQSVIETFFAN